MSPAGLSLPAFFGPYRHTELVLTLFEEGPLSFAELMRRGYDSRVLHKAARAASGLVSEFKQKKTGTLALRLSIERASDKELYGFIRAIYSSHGANAHSPKAEGWPQVPKRAIDYTRLFGSRVRTCTLIAVEHLGKRATTGSVSRAVAGESPAAVRNSLSYWITVGVLVRDASMITIAPQPWAKALRALLRRAAHSVPTITTDAIVAAASVRTWNTPHDYAPHRRTTATELFYRSLQLRILGYLVEHGPSQQREIFSFTRTSKMTIINRLVEMGVLSTRKVDRKRFYSLNRAYPVYGELRALVAKLVNQDRLRSQSDFIERKAAFEVLDLFGAGMRVSLLVLVATQNGITGSDYHLLYSRRAVDAVYRLLRRLQAAGYLRVTVQGRELVYRLDSLHRVAKELKALLLAINREWRAEFEHHDDLLEIRPRSGRRH